MLQSCHTVARVPHPSRTLRWVECKPPPEQQSPLLSLPSFACHSERIEEPPYFAFAFALLFAFVLASAVVLAFLVVIPEGDLLLSLSLFPQPPQNGCPIHRALCDWWDVNRPPATEPLLLPLLPRRAGLQPSREAPYRSAEGMSEAPRAKQLIL